ncbi:hypothetical protein BOX15_Mlig009785g2, partial [Macrostomum lignano]
RYAQLVIGPAGSGKSTYCANLQRHAEACRRRILVANLDPAAEHFDYQPVADVRDLIQVHDAMEDSELAFGPNGGLVFCMDYLAHNLDWLDNALDAVAEDEYLLLDCPGQIELYCHLPVMRQIVDYLQSREFRLCSVFVLDSQFLVDPCKLVSGLFAALSAMVNLELPHVNLLSKLDLLSRAQKRQLADYLEPDLAHLLAEHGGPLSARYAGLNAAVVDLIDSYSLVRFVPFDVSDEQCVTDALLQVDMALQYGEDLEPQERDYEAAEGGAEHERVNGDGDCEGEIGAVGGGPQFNVEDHLDFGS